MHVRISTPSGNRTRVSGFLRLFIFSLLAAALPMTSLHGQTVAYVTNTGSNTVSVIDNSTKAVTATIPVGNNPVGVAFSPDGARAYVTNAADGTVSVIDTGGNAVTATIPVTPASNSALGLPAITPDGKSLYVPDLNNGLFVVSTATNSVVATLPGTPGIAVAISPDGTRAYVQTALSFFTGVPVIDTAANAVVTTISPVDGIFGIGIADTPNGLTLYVAGGEFQDVSAITTSSNTVTATIPFTGAPEGIAVTPDGSRAYVSIIQFISGSPTTVGIIDTATNTLEPTSITVGASGSSGEAIVCPCLAITPDGAFVYVTNSGDGTVSVIDTSMNAVVGTVTVGNTPQGIAIANLSTPFAAFTVPNLSISPNLTLNGNLTLGANTGGLDFAHQPLTLTVGNFTLTIPPGTVKQVGGNMHFTFHGFINGQKVDFDLKAANGSSTQFSFSLAVKGATVNTNNPATVTLKIGHNSGTTTAAF